MPKSPRTELHKIWHKIKVKCLSVFLCGSWWSRLCQLIQAQTQKSFFLYFSDFNNKPGGEPAKGRKSQTPANRPYHARVCHTVPKSSTYWSWHVSRKRRSRVNCTSKRSHTSTLYFNYEYCDILSAWCRVSTTLYQNLKLWHWPTPKTDRYSTAEVKWLM